MFSEKDLRELLEFSANQPILSVYLKTLPSEGNADAHKLHLRNLLKAVPLQQEADEIEHYVAHEHDWTGRSLALFSCVSRDFFRAYRLALPVPDQVYISNRPAVRPLVDLLDAFGGYGVVLVDKQGARLFYFHLGELREQEGVMGEVVKHTKHGGASAFPGRRGGTAGQTNYQEEIVDRNMKEVADVAAHFFEDNHVRRILLGGTDENVVQFRSQLPKAWQSLIVGSFPMSMSATAPEVLNKAMEIGSAEDHQRETHMIDTVITASAKGSAGAVGLDATLHAIHDGRVQTLLVSDDFHQPAFHCLGCGDLTIEELESCPYCGGAFEKIPDVVEHAMMDVMKIGGEIEVIHENPELQKIGRIGAVLRY